MGGAIPHDYSLEAQAASSWHSLAEPTNWEAGPSLSCTRHALALAVDFEEDALYAIGGRLTTDEALRQPILNAASA